MQIDKRQGSTCTSSMSLVLNNRNIYSEEIVLLNNNNKVSLVLFLHKIKLQYHVNYKEFTVAKIISQERWFTKEIENILNFARIII